MEINLTDYQLQNLKSSSDFNIICILQNHLIENTLSLSDYHSGLLYDFCCDSNDSEIINIANEILKNDRNSIKPITLTEI